MDLCLSNQMTAVQDKLPNQIQQRTKRRKKNAGVCGCSLLVHPDTAPAPDTTPWSTQEARPTTVSVEGPHENHQLLPI